MTVSRPSISINESTALHLYIHLILPSVLFSVIEMYTVGRSYNRTIISRLSAWGNSLLRPSSSRNISTTPSFVTLPRELPIEEETLPYYKPEQYYPVNIGDVYNARYQIAGKLGYGAYSTNWLCQDLQCVAFSTIPSTPATFLLTSLSFQGQ